MNLTSSEKNNNSNNDYETKELESIKDKKQQQKDSNTLKEEHDSYSTVPAEE